MIEDLVNWAWNKPHLAAFGAASMFVLGKMSFEIFFVALTQTH